MFGLTQLGLFHTVISLIAVAAGIWSFVRDKQIIPATVAGKVYILMTIVTCLTGFGIFEHGGFGKAHVLGLITLLTLVVAGWAPRSSLPSRLTGGVQTGAYSATFFFHLIPGVTETATRLPPGNPIFPNADAPGLQATLGALFIVFVVAVTLQVIWLGKRGIANIPVAQ